MYLFFLSKGLGTPEWPLLENQWSGFHQVNRSCLKEVWKLSEWLYENSISRAIFIAFIGGPLKKHSVHSWKWLGLLSTSVAVFIKAQFFGSEHYKQYKCKDTILNLKGEGAKSCCPKREFKQPHLQCSNSLHLWMSMIVVFQWSSWHGPCCYLEQVARFMLACVFSRSSDPLRILVDDLGWFRGRKTSSFSKVLKLERPSGSFKEAQHAWLSIFSQERASFVNDPFLNQRLGNCVTRVLSTNKRSVEVWLNALVKDWTKTYFMRR